MKEQKQVKNPKGMLLMTGIVIILVLYLEWKVIDSYLKGGEGAASLTLVIVSSILMVAGCVFIGWLAIRLYRQAREAAEDIPEGEIVPASEETAEADAAEETAEKTAAEETAEETAAGEDAADKMTEEVQKEEAPNDPKL